MSTTGKLKYLFKAHYDDGEYIQPEDDRSIYHKGEGDWNPSAFRDIDHERLIAFTLFNDDDTIYVDIKTGDITYNGEQIYTSQKRNAKKKLIYYRIVQQDKTGGVVGEPHVVYYMVGWETTGKNKEKIEIQIDG